MSASKLFEIQLSVTLAERLHALTETGRWLAIVQPLPPGRDPSPPGRKSRPKNERISVICEHSSMLQTLLPGSHGLSSSFEETPRHAIGENNSHFRNRCEMASRRESGCGILQPAPDDGRDA